MLLPPFPPKAPRDRFDYPFDFSGSLLPNETLTTATIACAPAGLVGIVLGVFDQGVLVWLEAGAAATRYLLTCNVVTSQGRNLTATAPLFVGPDGLDDPGLTNPGTVLMATQIMLLPIGGVSLDGPVITGTLLLQGVMTAGNWSIEQGTTVTNAGTIAGGTLAAPVINGGTLNGVSLASPAITGTLSGITLASPALTGALTLAGATTSGNWTIGSGTTVTNAGTIAGGTLTAPAINGGTINSAALASPVVSGVLALAGATTSGNWTIGAGSTVTNAGTIAGGTMVGGDVSAATVIAMGAATARTAAARAADVINVKDMGAVGNGGQYTSSFAITAGQRVLTATSPVFANAVAGMAIGVPNAGTTATTGRCTALPSVSGGDGYTSTPTITLSGSPTEAATVLVFMGLKAATLTSGGTGGPASTTVVLNIATVTAVVPVQISVTTDGSGNITGTPTVIAGQWAGRFPVLTGNPAVGSPFAVAPVFSFNIQVDHYGIGGLANPQSGYGSGYPLTGITASISGGSPGTPAVPGVPVITPYIQTLGTTIASVQSSTQVTLTAAAATTLNASTTVTYGTDDTAAIQAAVNRATVVSSSVYFPNSSGFYLTDQITLPSYTVIDGPGQLGMAPASNNSMFNAGANSHITIKNVHGLGNSATCLNPSSGSCFLISSPGASDISVYDTHLSHWTRHGIDVDGIAGGKFCRNTIDHIYYGAGIILSTTTVSSAVVADSNVVSFTQFAGIEAGFEGLIGCSITSNQITSCGNNGYGDGTSGHTSDGITGYTAFATNELTVVTGNTLINSGNNGIHWGGSRVLIGHNTIKYSVGACIFIGAYPNSAPPELSDIRIIGNHCTGLDKTNPVNTGISMRNVIGAVVMGNTVTSCYDGAEIYGFTSGTGARDFTITGNEFNAVTIGVWLRHKVQYSFVGGNVIQNAGVGIQLDNTPVTGDGSFPSFFNTIGTNVHDAVTIPVVEANGTDFNTIDYQVAVNGSGTTNTIIGAHTVVQSPGGALAVFPTPGTYSFAFPPYATSVGYMVVGGGSSGANGHAQASGTATSGGAGGSAGACIPLGGGFKFVPASSLTSPVTVVVGAGGASPSGDGAAGNTGGQSRFGTDIAFGAGAPSGGAATTNSASGASGCVLGVGHSASGATAGTATATNYNIAGVAGGTNGGTSAFTGATGGASPASGGVGTSGGQSITNPAGGGGGAGMAGTQVGLNGGAGGATGGLTAPAGGVSGTSNGDAPALTAAHAGPGMGGGGGASQVATRGGNGADGVDGGGGGGGGSCGTGQTPGIGGKGGDGLVLAFWR